MHTTGRPDRLARFSVVVVVPYVMTQQSIAGLSGPRQTGWGSPTRQLPSPGSARHHGRSAINQANWW